MTTERELLRPEDIRRAKDCIKATLHVNQPTAGASNALFVALAALESYERVVKLLDDGDSVYARGELVRALEVAP